MSVSETGVVTREIENADLDAFDTHDLLIKVAYSSLNYKDALSASGNKGISRFYPHTPGIDASGVVIRSKDSHFKEGDKIIVTGYDLGMNSKGGFSEYISVSAHWAIPLPENLSLKEAMILGTAGLTAAMSIDKILNSDLRTLPVIISGATGGVGSLTLMILKKLGIETVAYSRRPETVDYLKFLGAKEVIHQFEESPKPMLKGLYSAGIDTVGQIEMYFHAYDSNWDNLFKNVYSKLETSEFANMDTTPNDEGQELYNADGVRIVGKTVDENSFWGTAILLYIENTSGQNVGINVDNMSINGYMMTPLFSTTVYDGKKSIDDITIMSSDLEANGITSVDQVELKFHIYNAESYDTIADSDAITFTAQ